MQKLIIIRGPSGSGKSTAAKALMDGAKDGTALIAQDYYRFIFKPPGHANNSKTIRKMIRSDVVLALQDGYDVILEGIFIKKGWQKVFESIFSWHPDNNFVFTYDISFDETIRRHRNKPNRHEWKESDMADWYKDHDFLGYDFEYKIPESFTQQQILEFILAKTSVK